MATQNRHLHEPHHNPVGIVAVGLAAGRFDRCGVAEFTPSFAVALMARPTKVSTQERETDMGITDKIKNEAEELTGKGKEAVGRVGHDEDLQAEGKVDQAQANAKKAGEHVKDAGTARSARSAADWLFRDRSTGRYVIVQWPNLPLLVFIALRAVEWVTGATGTAGNVLHWVGNVALLWWAVGELVWGVNPFRRMLGAGVLLVMAVGSIAAVAGG